MNAICPKCKIEKEVCSANFHWRKDVGDSGGWRRICKLCHRKQADKWTAENEAKMKAWRKEWEKEHNKKYYAENREKELLRTRNKPKEATRRYNGKRNLRPSHRIRKSISHSISRYITKNAGSKGGLSHLRFVDWTYEKLLAHLESLFEPWMTWINYGRYDRKTWNDDDPSTWTWQIDHIIPHSGFKYSSMKDQSFRGCWALSNLRPYSSKQNNLDRDRR